MFATTLRSFCSKLNIEETDMKRAESLHDFRMLLNLDAGQLRAANQQDYDVLSQTFGSALTIRVARGEVSLFVIDRGVIDNASLQSGLQRLQALSNTITLKFELSINKQSLFETLGTDTDRCYPILYFFKDGFLDLLLSDLVSHDRNLFASTTKPTLVIISEEDLHFSGRLLTIINEKHAEEYRKNVLAVEKRTIENVSRFMDIVDENLNWSGFKFSNITPFHYLGTWKSRPSPDIEKYLKRAVLHLAILYTANRSNYDNGSFQAAYNNSERTSTMRLGDELLQEDHTSALTRLVLWPSSGKNNDHLTLLQNIVARELDSENSAENYRKFVLRLPNILGDARWHHRVFINGKVDRHFEELQKVADFADQMSRQVSESIETLTKNFTDTLLTTSGAIIIAFLATLIENKTQSAVFTVSIQIYAVYVLLMAIYRMASIYHSYRITESETSARLEVFSDKLGREKTAASERQVTRRKRQFTTWFWITVGTYLLLTIILWFGSSRVPEILVQQGIIAPSPSSTATQTPTVTTQATVTITPIATAPPTSTILPKITPTILPTRTVMPIKTSTP